MKCALCHEGLDIEHPETVYALNPNTFRKATMHSFCFRSAYEDLANMDSRKPELYLNRKDEYDSLSQDYF